MEHINTFKGVLKHMEGYIEDFCELSVSGLRELAFYQYWLQYKEVKLEYAENKEHSKTLSSWTVCHAFPTPRIFGEAAMECLFSTFFWNYLTNRNEESLTYSAHGPVPPGPLLFFSCSGHWDA